MKRVAYGAVAAAVLVAGAARGQELGVGSGQGWSVLTGRTVGAGTNVAHGQVGWPGLSASLLHGLTEDLDLGGRFTFDYGFEGLVSGPVVPGLELQALLRFRLLDTERFNLAVNVGFGPLLYFFRALTRFGLSLPVGVVLGIPVSSALNVAVGLDLPVYLTFGPGDFSFPILVGGGLEYFIDQSLAATFHVRMGPTLNAGWAPFTLEAQLGVAYRL